MTGIFEVVDGWDDFCGKMVMRLLVRMKYLRLLSCSK